MKQSPGEPDRGSQNRATIPKARLGNPKRKLVVPKPRLGHTKPRFWVPKPRLGVPKPRLGGPKPRLGHGCPVGNLNRAPRLNVSKESPVKAVRLAPGC